MLQAAPINLKTTERPHEKPHVSSNDARSTTKRLASLRTIAPVLATLGLSVAVGITLVHYRAAMMGLGSWGYAGIFFAETASSASVLIPTPSMAYTLAMSQFLNPVLVGIIGGFGSALGELVGYALGMSGRHIVKDNFAFAWLQKIGDRRIGPTLFLFAALPVPFDIAGIWAGTMKYSPSRFFLFVMTGKVVKFTAIGFAGHYGIEWLLNLV